jgi:polysaccharide pyruvyl transferase WcaK-like protein
METRNNMKIYNVWHIGAWNRNVGDWALCYQMHRLLNEQAMEKGMALKFHMVDSQRTFFYPELIDQMNEEADLIIIGGGGLIFLRPEDSSRSGWSFNISIQEMERIRKPIVVYGVGYNRFRFDPNNFPEVTSRHLSKLQEKSALFSVRADGTYKVLIEEFGLNSKKIDVIPDPGICLYDRPMSLTQRQKEGPVIAVNWAGDRPHYRYPEPHESNEKALMNNLKSALVKCVKELDAQVMFLPHLMNIDTDMYPTFAEGFPEGKIFSTHLTHPFLYPPPGEMIYPHVPFFTNLFRQADVMIGMRFHSCVLAFGAGAKIMPLGSHPKVGGLLEEVGKMDYSLPFIDPKNESSEAVFIKISECLKDKQYQLFLDGELAAQIKNLKEFNKKILNIFENMT